MTEATSSATEATTGAPKATVARPEPARRSAAVDLGRAFKGCLAAVRRLRGRETRHPGELSDAQFSLLSGLREHPSLPTSELACLADLSPATATGMLESLAAGGLVARERSTTDRRVVLTSLTEQGRALVEARYARQAPRWEAALARFSDAELQSAAEVLDALRVMFDELRPDDEPDGGAAPGS